MEDDPLRPSMPTERDAQLRWMIGQNTNAMIALTTELSRFRASAVGGALPGGKYGTAVLVLLVWLAAVSGGMTALAWASP